MAGLNIPVYWDEEQFKKVSDETKLYLTGGNVTGSLTMNTNPVLNEGYACYPIIKDLTDANGKLFYKGLDVGPAVGTYVKIGSKIDGDCYRGTTNPTNATRLNYDGNFHATRVYGSVYNDYAEYRKSDCTHVGGTVVTEAGDGKVIQTKKRLSKIPMVVSDTWGFIIGDANDSVPIAVAGRVLVHTDKDRRRFKVGDAVCSGINGTVSRMKWWEKIVYPDRLLGVVSEVPLYELWGNDSTKVSSRIWIKI